MKICYCDPAFFRENFSFIIIKQTNSNVNRQGAGFPVFPIFSIFYLFSAAPDSPFQTRTEAKRGPIPLKANIRQQGAQSQTRQPTSPTAHRETQKNEPTQKITINSENVQKGKTLGVFPFYRFVFLHRFRAVSSYLILPALVLYAVSTES